MKKLLLILLCLPIIGFGQDDCGNKPIKPKKKMGVSNWDHNKSKEYKKWKNDVELWQMCKDGKDTTRFYRNDFPFDEKTGLVSFEEVIKCDSISKDELYSILREWFVTTFGDAETVLQMDDRKSGKLIGKGITSVSSYNSWCEYIKFTLKIYIKEGRFKYVLTSIKLYQPYKPGSVYTRRIEKSYDIESFFPYWLYSKKGIANKRVSYLKDDIFIFNQSLSSSFNSLINNYLNNNDDDDDDW